MKFIKPFVWWFKLSLWQQILLALLAGVIVGITGGHHVLFLQPLGVIFIHAIQMMVVPVVFTAIVCAVISVADLGQMRNVAWKAISIYVVCMMVSAALGMLSATLLNAGAHFHLHAAGVGVAPVQAMPSFAQVLVSFVPANPIRAFADGNVIQIFVFAILLGVAIKLTGKQAEPVVSFFKSFSAVVFRFAGLIVQFAPYGVFALLACVFAKYGLDAMLPLLKFVASVYLGCFLLLGFFAAVLLLNSLNPLKFAKAIFSAMVLGYTTSSSAATLPVTFRVAEKNLKLAKKMTAFLLPLGTSLNLNGLSIYLSAAAIFSAHIYGVHLGLMQYVTIAITIVFTAIGAAAVPGSALIVMGAVMSSVGIPLGALPLIAGVDRFNDMAQTATNVVGDLFAATVVAKSEGLMGVSTVGENKVDLAEAN